LFINNIKYVYSDFLSTQIGDGDWGLGIGDWGLGPIPNPESPSPIPNPQSPIPMIFVFNYLFKIKIFYIIN
jgi:hypothetical protein